MSHPSHPNKPSVGGFKLSSNFNQLYAQKKQQTEQFIKEITDNREPSKEKSKQKSTKKATGSKSQSTGSLFKFNTMSEALVDEVPVEVLKKRSQSRLESMHDSLDDSSKNKFQLLENQSQRKENILRERKQLLKKYNIDLNAVMSQPNAVANTLGKPIDNRIQQQDPQGTVKPSQLYTIKQKTPDPFTTPTIFQTPLLPCFASEFSPNPSSSAPKTIREGQGVWRIGKIKIKNNKAVIKIGEIQFESELISAEGKCVGVRDDFMSKLRNWNGMWVCQPKQESR